MTCQIGPAILLETPLVRAASERRCALAFARGMF